MTMNGNLTMTGLRLVLLYLIKVNIIHYKNMHYGLNKISKGHQSLTEILRKMNKITANHNLCLQADLSVPSVNSNI